MAKINIASLKELVLKECKPGNTLREVILQEPDELTYDEMIAKGPIWLRLLGLDVRR